MQKQLEHYLQRARVAAQRDSVIYRTPAVATLKRMVRVVEKLKPELKFSFNAPAEEILFAGEREDLEEIAGNLLENAMKWGKSHARVSLVAAEAGDDEPGTFALVIEDDGPGIPEDQIEAVFEPFRRLEASRNRGTGGSGLGLTIARRAVEQHGGTLTLGNRPGGGLVVTARLPRPRA
jgi:signal transduction histidine kinase